MLTILETCRVSPPSATVGKRSLPLSFFDTFWLLLPPVHQLFFYEFPHSRSHFVQTIILSLKNSLSITLQHFFPFTGNLIVFPNPNDSSVVRKPEICHEEGDSVSVTFAECTLDFNHLTGNHPRECSKLFPLVPLLGRPTKIGNQVKIPLFSVQVTLFPNMGISIGITNHHSLCDASTKFHFLEAWTSIARHGTDEFFLNNGFFPLYDRVIKYPDSLDQIFLNQSKIQTLGEEYKPPHSERVLATMVLTRSHIVGLKQWLQSQLPTLEYTSSFTVACAFVWSCVVKSRAQQKDLERFVCIAEWRARFNPPIPQTYFGNCVAPCFTNKTKSTMLLGEKGFVTAAALIGTSINKMVKNKDGMLKDAETWMEIVAEQVSVMPVAGSPKIKIYNVDFGWGKPKKYEVISIDYGGSISVNAFKESSEDLEIGLTLPSKQMEAFITIFEKELESMC